METHYLSREGGDDSSSGRVHESEVKEDENQDSHEGQGRDHCTKTVGVVPTLVRKGQD